MGREGFEPSIFRKATTDVSVGRQEHRTSGGVSSTLPARLTVGSGRLERPTSFLSGRRAPNCATTPVNLSCVQRENKDLCLPYRHKDDPNTAGKRRQDTKTPLGRGVFGLVKFFDLGDVGLNFSGPVRVGGVDAADLINILGAPFV